MVMTKLKEQKIVKMLKAGDIERLGCNTKIVLPSKEDPDIRVYGDLFTGPMIDIIAKIRKKVNVCAFISCIENELNVRFHD